MELPAPWLRRLQPLVWGLATALLAWGAATVAVERVADAARAALVGYAPTYAADLAGMGHADLPERLPTDDAAYLDMVARQRAWEMANPRVRDIWTLRRMTDGRIVHFVDAESDFNQNGAIDTPYEHRLPPGAIDATPLSDAATRAFRGETEVDFTVRRDARGSVIEGWAPLRGEDGRVAAVVGVAFDAWPVQALFTATACLAGGLVLAWGLALGLMLRIRGIRQEARQRLAEAAFLQDEALRSRDVATVASARAAVRIRSLLDALPVPAALRAGERLHVNPALRERLGGEPEGLDDFFRLGWGPQAAPARTFYTADRAAGFPEARRLTIGAGSTFHRWFTAADADQELWLFVGEASAVGLSHEPANRGAEPEPVVADDPLVTELALTYVEDLPTRVSELADAARAGDLDTARLLVEQLAGAADTHGYHFLAAAATRVAAAWQGAVPAASIAVHLLELEQAADELHRAAARTEAG